MVEQIVKVVEADVPVPQPQPAPAPRPPAAALRKSRTRSLLSSIFSWNALINLVLLWILGSLAGQVARLRAEVAFVADEARDLRLYGFDRRAERGGDWDQGRRGRADRVRGQDDWADSAVTTPPSAVHTSAPDTASDAADADLIDAVLEEQEHARRKHGHAVAPRGGSDGAEYGLGRVVFNRWAWLEYGR